jgi:hypothetical protein
MSNTAGLLKGWKGVLPVIFMLLGVSLSAGIALAGLPAGTGGSASPLSKNTQAAAQGRHVAPVRDKMEIPVRAGDSSKARNPDKALYGQHTRLNETTISSQDFERAYNRYDGQASPTPIPGCGLYWRIVDSPSAGQTSSVLYDVAIVSATDVWAVGYFISESDDYQTLIMRWNGNQWNLVPSPNMGDGDNTLFGISVISANDAWAVGEYSTPQVTTKALILHWDGGQWSIIDGPDIGDSDSLNQVDVITSNDVWAVGEYGVKGGSRSLAMHWDGSTWTQVATPFEGQYNALRGVSAVGANDIWAVGNYYESSFGFEAFILHWDGTAWNRVPVPNLPGESNLNSVSAISASDAWAVGYYIEDGISYHTFVLQWTGADWTWVSSPRSPDNDTLLDVSALSPSDVWAVGWSHETVQGSSQTITIHWDGSTWTRVPSPNSDLGVNYLYGVVAVGANDVWAVGGYAGGVTLVERYSDPCASPTNTPAATDTPVATSTPTITNTPTSTNIPTETPIGTVTSTRTNTPMPTPTACTLSFTDVPQSNAFYVHVRCLACRGILGGYSDGTFRPNNDITRGQLSKIVANSAGFNEPVSGQTFQDVLIGSTFYAFIERMAARGIIGGYACGGMGEPCGASNKPYFRPNANATRGQISKIVSNAKGYNDPTGSQIFEDVPPGSAFYDWVQRLASRGIMGGYPCGGPGEPCGSGNKPYFRPNNNATRGQVSKIVANTFFPGCNPPAGR